MSPRAINVKYKTPYQLVITFTNKEVKEFNLEPYLKYPVYERLKDEAYCQKATVHDGVIIWDSETDFDPDTIYLEGRPVSSIQ